MSAPARFLAQQWPAGEEGPPEETLRYLGYSLTHEIFALTDFGLDPNPPVLQEYSREVSRLLDTLISWTLDTKDDDLLAELFLSAHFLALSDLGTLPTAQERLMSLQADLFDASETRPSSSEMTHKALVTAMAIYATCLPHAAPKS